MLAQSLLAQMRADSQLTLQNVCANLEWMGVLTKVRAVLNFSASVAPWDAVLFAEPDALINVPLKADDLLLRFDLARGVHSLVFQAEPICYAPWGLWSAPGSTGLNGGSAALWGGPVFSQSYCQEHLLELYETSLEAAGVQPFQCPRFLNFGGFMGSATRLVEFMRMLLEPPAAMVARSNCFRSMNADRTGFSWEFGGDQCFAHHLLLERPQLQATLDRREMLFATGYVVRDSSESAPNALDGHQCGRSACSLSTHNQWRLGWIKHMAWSRLHADHYAHLCDPASTLPLPPVIIHFNGPPEIKSLIRPEQVHSWLEGLHDRQHAHGHT